MKSDIGAGSVGGGLVHLRKRDEEINLDIDPRLRLLERLWDFSNLTNRNSQTSSETAEDR